MADDKDKAKPAPKKPTGGVFDVRRPGKAPASPTSRPVILGHKPEAQAAQMAVSGVGEASPIINRRKIQIMPSGDIQAVGVRESTKIELTTPAEPVAENVPETEKETLPTAAPNAVSGPPNLPEEPEKNAEDVDERQGKSMVFTKPKLTIAPPSESSKSEAEPKSAAEPAEAKPGAEETPASDAAEPKPEQPEPAAIEEQPAATATEETAPAAEGEQKTPAETEAQEGQEQQNEPPKPEPYIEPLFDEHGVIVSRHDHHHRHRGFKVFLLLLLFLILAAVALDVLLDLEILDLPNIPHTDYL